MKIKLKETGKIETLNLFDENGTNYANDFILNADFSSFKHDEDNDIYLCTQDVYDWWAPVISQQARINELLDELELSEDEKEYFEYLGTTNDLGDAVGGQSEYLKKIQAEKIN